MRLQVAALSSGDQRLRGTLQQEIEAGGLRAAPLVRRIQQVLAEGGSSPRQPLTPAASAPAPAVVSAPRPAPSDASPAAQQTSGKVGSAVDTLTQQSPQLRLFLGTHQSQYKGRIPLFQSVGMASQSMHQLSQCAADATRSNLIQQGCSFSNGTRSCICYSLPHYGEFRSIEYHRRVRFWRKRRMHSTVVSIRRAA